MPSERGRRFAGAPLDASAQPLLAASIYWHEGLDQALHQIVAPFRRALGEVGDGLSFLWAMRSVRCGEHLKLRIHAAESARGELVRRLEQLGAEVFAKLDRPSGQSPRESFPETPAIDAEDEGDELFPDRAVLWRRYRQLPGMFGHPPLSEEPALAARFPPTLAKGTDVVLTEFQPAPGGEFTQKMRTSLVTKLFLAGVARLGMDRQEAAEYFGYHRDWLVLATAADYPRTIATFERHAAASRPQIEALAELTAAARNSDSHFSPDLAAWTVPLRELFAEARRLAPSATYRHDSYLKDQVWAPIFKSLHLLANLVRVGLFNEALICHLLRAACLEAEPFGEPLDEAAMVQVGAGWAGWSAG